MAFWLGAGVGSVVAVCGAAIVLAMAVIPRLKVVRSRLEWRDGGE
jgi:hypothetical protein